jgi:hypothetical protein
MGQSPFAISRGVTFEASLLRDDARALRDELARKGVPGANSSGLVDLRLRINGGKVKDQEEAWQKTRNWLLAAASDPSAVVPLVASPTLKVPGQPILLPEGVLAIDVLLLHVPTRDDERDDLPCEDPRWRERDASRDDPFRARAEGRDRLGSIRWMTGAGARGGPAQRRPRSHPAPSPFSSPARCAAHLRTSRP